MTGLVLDGVTVRYGEVVAVDGLDLEVAEGEVVALLGPSGCGKSSVLRAIAGLEPLAAGTVRFGGRDLSGLAIHRRDLGLMFQDHALFPNLDVAGNVAFGLRRRHWSRPDIEARVTELLGLVGLAGFGRRPVSALSGGEAQRVALARALAPQPRLLMLDEPLGALDRSLREQLTGELRMLLGQLGQTALHVTHDQAEAFALADRVAVLRAGRVAQIGRPDELWARPDDGFVARFLGHPNVWSVTVDADGTLRWGGLVLGRHPDAAAVGAGAAELVVPLTAVHVADERPPGSGIETTATMDGLVERVELRDGVHRLTVATAQGPVVAMTGRPRPVGQEVGLVVDLDVCRVLPAPSPKTDSPHRGA